MIFDKNKKVVTKLIFRKFFDPKIEEEALKTNFKNIVEPTIIKFLLKYKEKLKISNTNVPPLIKDIEKKSHFIIIEIETPKVLDIPTFNQMRSEIKNFLVRDNYYKYISMIDESEIDEFQKLDSNHRNEFLH